MEIWKEVRLEKDLMLTQLIAKPDYQLLVKKLQRIGEDHTPLGHTVNQTQKLINGIGNVKISYVPRNFNRPTYL